MHLESCKHKPPMLIDQVWHFRLNGTSKFLMKVVILRCLPKSTIDHNFPTSPPNAQNHTENYRTQNDHFTNPKLMFCSWWSWKNLIRCMNLWVLNKDNNSNSKFKMKNSPNDHATTLKVFYPLPQIINSKTLLDEEIKWLENAKIQRLKQDLLHKHRPVHESKPQWRHNPRYLHIESIPNNWCCSIKWIAIKNSLYWSFTIPLPVLVCNVLY